MAIILSIVCQRLSLISNITFYSCASLLTERRRLRRAATPSPQPGALLSAVAALPTPTAAAAAAPAAPAAAAAAAYTLYTLSICSKATTQGEQMSYRLLRH